jgi:glycosyltransferase, group 2 family
MLMISIGTVGLYIAKIYGEVKHRPLYNISQILD